MKASADIGANSLHQLMESWGERVGEGWGRGGEGRGVGEGGQEKILIYQNTGHVCETTDIQLKR